MNTLLNIPKPIILTKSNHTFARWLQLRDATPHEKAEAIAYWESIQHTKLSTLDCQLIFNLPH